MSSSREEAVASKAETSQSSETTALEIPVPANSSTEKTVEYLETGSDENLQNRLWVGNLDYRISEYQVIKILQRFGKIKYFYYPYSKSLENPQASGYCFVEYNTREEAETAKKGLEGRMILNRTVRVSWSTGRSQSAAKQSTDAAPAASGGRSASTSDKINAIEAKLLLMQHGQEAVINLGNRPRPKTPYERPGSRGRGGGRGRGRGGRGGDRDRRRF